MRDPSFGPTNVAGDFATVGVQAEAVHGDVNVYTVSPNASPHEKFEVGVRYLHGGVPEKAREHITEAVVDGYVTSRSCYYLLLALLSGRTLQQVSKEDFSVLRSVRGRIAGRSADRWTDGLRMIDRLLIVLQKEDVDPHIIDEELAALDAAQRDEILRHLEMFLSGPVQDGLWIRAFESARKDRCDGRRLDRVWKFFQPKPMEARVRAPRPVASTTGDWIRSAAAMAVALVSVLAVVGFSWQHAWPATAFAMLLMAAGCHTCVWAGAEWKTLTYRRQAKDREHLSGVRRTLPAPQRGFASRIDRQFDYYFGRYLPEGVSRSDWLSHTAGIRQTLRDEVVSLYRESRIGAERVAWLTRYHASDVRNRWVNGTLWAYRDQLRVPASTKMLFTLGFAATSMGGAIATWSGLHVRPVTVIAAMFIAVVAGCAGVSGWTRIVAERRRFDAEQAELSRLKVGREAALQRWKDKLADRPSDAEMAHWLDCDRKALMDEAMRHYKLSPRDIVAHAFIEAPGARYDRGRVPQGPWRYSRYKLLIFLLTADGVRQVTAELDFEKATFHDRGRTNYRYDAVAAVRVAEADDGHKSLELTLMDGQSMKLEMTGPPADVVELEADTPTASQVTLDAAGLGNTLHVLEGVAAEGKEWINNERAREQGSLDDLAATTRGMFF
ncbi:hypothetical protein SAMN05421505_113141 [Sinosporangium album]|uniref:Uncharacterized protein n=1 Tax=Sinosporangium album TaxID=504805 RepID=A0A1G8B526_9ACTN|nr:hypothetical protein [Sinosporangium album]SDH28297.1 hypothetical protein SAMN05421505_113141 [Sinosporangium album]